MTPTTIADRRASTPEAYSDPLHHRDVTLLDLADRLLERGVVLSGDILLCVAGIDLVKLSLRVLLASADTLTGDGTAGRDGPR